MKATKQTQRAALTKAAFKAIKLAAKAKPVVKAKRHTFDPQATIMLATKANPYNAGTVAADTFDFFRQARTVGEFRALTAGAPADTIDPGYLRYASRDGYIIITPNPYEQAHDGARYTPAPRKPRNERKPAAPKAKRAKPEAL